MAITGSFIGHDQYKYPRPTDKWLPTGWYASQSNSFAPLLDEYRDFHGFGVYTPRGEQKEASSREQTPPMGCTISVPSLCRWVTQTLCTYGRRTKDHREMLCSTIWRSLLCISHSSENLAEWFLLAIYVWRYKELHPKMPKLLEAWRTHSSQCDAPNV